MQDLYESFEKELAPLFKENKEEQKENPTSIVNDPLLIENPSLMNKRRLEPRSSNNYGRADLDPLHFDPAGRGGMIFDPFRGQDHRNIPSNLPPGAVPPGARFDPFGPPDPDDLRGSSSRVGYVDPNSKAI